MDTGWEQTDEAGLGTRLASFIRQSLNKPELADGDNIYEVGGASSMFAMELVLYIEQQLGIELADSDLERENFDSIETMTALVERKVGTV